MIWLIVLVPFFDHFGSGGWSVYIVEHCNLVLYVSVLRPCWGRWVVHWEDEPYNRRMNITFVTLMLGFSSSLIVRWGSDYWYSFSAIWGEGVIGICRRALQPGFLCVSSSAMLRKLSGALRGWRRRVNLWRARCVWRHEGTWMEWARESALWGWLGQVRTHTCHIPRYEFVHFKRFWIKCVRKIALEIWFQCLVMTAGSHPNRLAASIVDLSTWCVTYGRLW